MTNTQVEWIRLRLLDFGKDAIIILRGFGRMNIKTITSNTSSDFDLRVNKFLESVELNGTVSSINTSVNVYKSNRVESLVYTAIISYNGDLQWLQSLHHKMQ